MCRVTWKQKSTFSSVLLSSSNNQTNVRQFNRRKQPNGLSTYEHTWEFHKNMGPKTDRQIRRKGMGRRCGLGLQRKAI